MNNIYDGPAGAGSGDWDHGSDPAGTTAPQASAPPRRPRTKRMLGWAGGITLAGFLAGGGIALAVSGATNPATPGAPATPAASTGPAVTQAQGMMLNSALNTAASTSAAVPAHRVRSALGRLRLLGGIYGQVTFRYQGGYRTLAFERGTIQYVSGSTVAVRAQDGTTWTWQIVSDTVVRRSGSKTTTGALSAGETVFAGGPVVSGARDARLIVIRPTGSSSSGSSSGTSSSSSVSGPSGTSVG